MDPFTAIAVGTSVASGVSSIFGSKKAAEEAKQAARDQAKYTYSQRMEELRRLQLEDTQIRGEAVAGAYASNVQVGTGSPATYLEQLQSEQRRQQAYYLWAAREEKQLIEESGQSPGLGIETIGKAASTFADAFGTYKNLTG